MHKLHVKILRTQSAQGLLLVEPRQNYLFHFERVGHVHLTPFNRFSQWTISVTTN